MSDLADMLAKGKYVSKYCNKADRYFLQSIDYTTDSLNGLGIIYQHSCGNFSKGISQSFRFSQRLAANTKQPTAQNLPIPTLTRQNPMLSKCFPGHVGRKQISNR